MPIRLLRGHNMTNKKPAERIPLTFNVEYRKNYSRSQDLGVLKNISLTGAYLEHSNSELKANSKVHITLNVGGRKRTLIASIIWADKKGAGICFIPENNRDKQIVDDLMYFVESKRETRRDVLDSIFNKVA